MHRYIPLIAKWNGYNFIGEKIVKLNKRKFGVTKFGMERFIRGFLDLLSVSFVYRFKQRPMHFFGSLGVLFFLIGFVSGNTYYIGLIFSSAAHMTLFHNFYSLLRKLSEPSELLPRSKGKIALCRTGFVSEPTTRSSGTLNAVTGAARS